MNEKGNASIDFIILCAVVFFIIVVLIKFGFIPGLSAFMDMIISKMNLFG